jgi:hypothetical protein
MRVTSLCLPENLDVLKVEKWLDSNYYHVSHQRLFTADSVLTFHYIIY